VWLHLSSYYTGAGHIKKFLSSSICYCSTSAPVTKDQAWKKNAFFSGTEETCCEQKNGRKDAVDATRNSAQDSQFHESHPMRILVMHGPSGASCAIWLVKLHHAAI